MRNLLVAKDVPSTSEKRLIVLSEHEVASLPLHRCSSSPQALTCDECVALRDPYCAWSLDRELCVVTTHLKARKGALLSTLR